MSQTKKLRPLGLADLLDETVELYKSNFALIVGISALISLPITIVSDVAADFRNAAWSMLPSLLWIAATPMLQGALILAISQCYLGERPRVLKFCRLALRSFLYWPILGVVVLQYLILVACLCVAVVPAGIFGMAGTLAGETTAGIVMMVAYLVGGICTAPLWARVSLAEPAVIMERKGAGAAISRSWDLMQGSVLKGGFAILVVYIMVYGVPILAGSFLAPLTGHKKFFEVPLSARLIEQAVALTITVVLSPLVAVVKTLLYFDLRVRKEAFDLELLAHGMQRREEAL